MTGEQPKTPSDFLPEAVDLEPSLRRFLSRRIPASDIDDVLQDIFLNLARSRSQVGVENVNAYLFRVAMNAVAAHARSRRAVIVDVDDFPDMGDEGISAERILMSRQELEAVMCDISALPERTRDVFMLHRFEDWTYPEIARALGISVSAVEKHMIKALRRILEAYRRR